MSRIITALFDDLATAERARQALVDLGVPPGRIGLHAAPPAGAVGATPHAPGAEPGLPRLLDALFLPEGESAAHREALRRGSVVITVQAEPGDAARLARAMDEAGAADLDALERDWQGGGAKADAQPGVTAEPAARPRLRREPRAGRARSYIVE